MSSYTSVRLLSAMLVCFMATTSHGFTTSPTTPTTTVSSKTSLSMGLFDGIMKAFENEEVRRMCSSINMRAGVWYTCVGVVRYVLTLIILVFCRLVFRTPRRRQGHRTTHSGPQRRRSYHDYGKDFRRGFLY